MTEFQKRYFETNVEYEDILTVKEVIRMVSKDDTIEVGGKINMVDVRTDTMYWRLDPTCK